MPTAQRRRPHHGPVDQLPEVLHHRIAAGADRARERGVRSRAERDAVRPADAGLAQLLERPLDRAGQLDRIARQRVRPDAPRR